MLCFHSLAHTLHKPSNRGEFQTAVWILVASFLNNRAIISNFVDSSTTFLRLLYSKALNVNYGKTSCWNGAITGTSAAVAEFGRVGSFGASQSFGLRRQANWLKVWCGGGWNFSATERAHKRSRGRVSRNGGCEVLRVVPMLRPLCLAN